MAYAGYRNERNARAVTGAVVLAAHVAVLFGVIALNRLPQSISNAANLVLVRVRPARPATLVPQPKLVPESITVPPVAPPNLQLAPAMPKPGNTGFGQAIIPLNLGLAPSGSVPAFVPKKPPPPPKTDAEKAKAEFDEQNRENQITSQPPPPGVTPKCKSVTAAQAGGGDPFGSKVCEDVPSMAELKDHSDNQQHWMVNPQAGRKAAGTTVTGDPDNQ